MLNRNTQILCKFSLHIISNNGSCLQLLLYFLSDHFLFSSVYLFLLIRFCLKGESLLSHSLISISFIIYYYYLCISSTQMSRYTFGKNKTSSQFGSQEPLPVSPVSTCPSLSNFEMFFAFWHTLHFFLPPSETNHFSEKGWFFSLWCIECSCFRLAHYYGSFTAPGASQ